MAEEFVRGLQEALHGAGPLRTARLSDLSDPDQMQLREAAPIWERSPVEKRRELVARLRELSDDNVDLHFKRLFLHALGDTDPVVRSSAVEGLWEEESIPVLERLEDLLRSDPDPDVRAAAASALGRFAYLACVGKLDPARSDQLGELLRRSLLDAPDGSRLQMRVVETLSYFPNEPLLPDQIERLYREGDEEEQACALLAMGRTMDPRWHTTVLSELDSPDPRLRFQAARAAGEMSLEEAVPALARVVEEGDAELRQPAIWALGQIGTGPATRLLQRLAQDEDEVIREAAEDALGEAQYAGD